MEQEKIEKIAQEELRSQNKEKLKVDVFVPLNACACVWEDFIGRIFAVLTPYIKHIDHETKSLNSEEARTLNLHGNCVIIDGEWKFSSSFQLKKELPNILREKGIIK